MLMYIAGKVSSTPNTGSPKKEKEEKIWHAIWQAKATLSDFEQAINCFCALFFL